MPTLSTNYSRQLDTSPLGVLVNLWLRKKNFLELEATEAHKNADHTAEHLRKVYLPATSTGRKHKFNLETCLGQYSYFLQRKIVKV